MKPPQFGKDLGVGLTQYYTATTLDGFIADSNHSLGWLFTQDQDRAGILNYAEFIADVGALAMGSTTYEWILEHDRAAKDPAEWKWPYDIPGWVFTSRQPEVVPEAPIEFVSGDVSLVHAEMVEAASGKARVDRRRRRSRRPVRGFRPPRRGHRLHRAGDARIRRSAAAPRGLRLEELGRNRDFRARGTRSCAPSAADRGAGVEPSAVASSAERRGRRRSAGSPSLPGGAVRGQPRTAASRRRAPRRRSPGRGGRRAPDVDSPRKALRRISRRSPTATSRRLCPCPLTHVASCNGLRGSGAGLEEPRRPEPLVDARALHA